MEPSSNNNLPLKILFVILFLALIGELGYIFMTVNKKNISILIAPTPTPTIVSTSKNVQNQDDSSADINNFLVVYYDIFEEKNIDNLHSTIELEGEIAGFQELSINDNLLQKMIKEKNKKGLYQLSIYNSNNNDTVLNISNSKTKDISFKDLKIGQRVRIIIKEDKEKLTERVYMSSITIAVLD